MTGAETFESQQEVVTGNLHALRSRNHGFETYLEGDVEEGFTQSFHRLVTSMLNLAAGCRRGNSDESKESTAPLREILAALEVNLTTTVPRLSDSSTADQ